MKYRVYGLATISKYLGEVEASSPKEAEDKACEELSDNMSFSICHQCSREMQDTPDITEIQVEEAA